MAAKKTLIQQLRKQVTELKTTNGNLKEIIKRRDRKIKYLDRDRFFSSEEIARYVEDLKQLFSQEIAWQDLSRNPNDQLRTLQFRVSHIRTLVDSQNKNYMSKHIDDEDVNHYYKLKMARIGK